MQRKPVSIFWFRRDLRLYDNVAFFHALNDSENVLPIFIFDSEILFKLENKRDARVEFIHAQLGKLKTEFEKQGSSLLILYGKPEEVFRRLLNKYQVTAAYINLDHEPFARKRDEVVEKFLTENGVKFFAFKDHVIFEKAEVLKPDGKPYTVFTPYSVRWKAALTLIPPSIR